MQRINRRITYVKVSFMNRNNTFQSHNGVVQIKHFAKHSNLVYINYLSLDFSLYFAHSPATLLSILVQIIVNMNNLSVNPNGPMNLK